MAIEPPKSKSAKAPMPIYEQSSQFRNWRYSPAGLAEIRHELNITAINRVRSMLEAERAAGKADPTSSASVELEGGDAPTPDSVEYLTTSDELSLVTYYLTQVPLLCRALRYPEAVDATAITYLKRFYLRNTCMDYHPKNIMLTSVFLATKTENHPVTIDSFARSTKTTPEDVLAFEFLVSQSLRFEYKVHHAHVALAGLVLDFQAADLPLDKIQPAQAAATAHVKTSRLTDLELIYAPSQIALACVNLADTSLVRTWLEGKQARRGVESDPGQDTKQVLDWLEEIGREITRAKESPVQKSKVAEVDRRLKFARNPEKDPSSNMYKKRQADEQAARDAHQQAKAAKRPPPTDDSSVFD